MSARNAGDGTPDQRAFAAFYATYFPLVVDFLRSLGAATDDAEDIANEAMMRAWSHRAELTTIDHTRAWVLRVARNLLKDHWRRIANHAVPVEDLSHVGSGVDDHPGRAVVAVEIRAQIGAALRALPPFDRQVAIATIINGISSKALAEQWQKNPGAVRTSKHRATVALRIALHDLRGVPAVPLLAWRRLSHAARTILRSFVESGAHTALHVASVLLTVVSVVVGPFDGPLGPIPSARADADVTQPGSPYGRLTEAAAPTQPRVSGPRRVAAGSSPRDGASPPPTRPRPSPPPAPALTLVEVCVDRVCTPGGKGKPEKDRTRVVVHLPKPIGDREATANVRGLCEWLPDAEAYDCHTEGDPDHSIPPPPPVP